MSKNRYDFNFISNVMNKSSLKDKALQMRINGMPYYKIAENLGVGTMTVWQWLNEKSRKKSEQA